MILFCFHVVASSSDFYEDAQDVWFSSKQTKAIAYIRINDDHVVENNKAFKLEILISQEKYNSGVKYGGQTVATFYIKDGEYSLTDQ